LKRGLPFLVLLSLAVARPGVTQSEPVVTTEHQLVLGGKPLRYRAQVGRVDVANSEDGELRARMFFVAYRVRSAAPRPVMFLWNGGPGAATTLLHYDAVAPVLLSEGRLTENPHTILPHADLVFVDAVGTGFSRLANRAFAPEFYNSVGDVAAFTEFVRAWRLLFDAEDSPVFLAGESFGANRAAGVAAGLLRRGVPVHGIALISGGMGLRSPLAPSLAQALRIPELAVISLHHGRGAIDMAPDISAVHRAARAWAVGTYAPALERIGALTDAERDSIVASLVRYTGIARDRIDRTSLVITPRQYREDLLRDEGKTLPLFDLRRTASTGYSRADQRLLQRYLRQTLGYRTSLPYAELGEDLATGYFATGVTSPDSAPRGVGARWNYFAPGISDEERARQIAEAVRTGGGPPGEQVPWAERALALHPRLKILVASGRYDAAHCEVTAESIRQLPPAIRAAYTFRCYDGGHMMYKDAPARVQLSRDLVALVTAGLQETPRPGVR